ncbi:MAG: hydrogen peroxide-inducible genes activator [Rhizobiaceae bacterium]
MKNLSSITLKQLHYFTVLSSSKSFSAAANIVHISQPALSLQIKALEQTFGGQLIERNKKSIILTPLGDQVRMKSATVLQQIEELELLIIRDHEHPVATVRLGLIPTVAPYLLPKIFPALRQDFNEIPILIREGRTKTLYKDILEDRIDLAIIALPIDEKGISYTPLFKEPFFVATGLDFKTPKTKTLTGKDLADYDILLLEEGHCLRDQTIQACGINMNAALNQFGASSLATIVEMVANGFGVTLLPQMALEKEASDPRIKLFPIRTLNANGKPINRELGLAWRSSSPYSALFQRMAKTIKKSGK